MRKCTICLAVAMIWTFSSNLIAQSAGASAGYLALVSTPAGSVPPIVKSWMLADPAAVPGVGIELLWGHLPYAHGNSDTFISGVSLPFAEGEANANLSIGFLLPPATTGPAAASSCSRAESMGAYFMRARATQR